MVKLLENNTTMRVTSYCGRRLGRVAALVVLLTTALKFSHAGLYDNETDIIQFKSMDDYVQRVEHGHEIWAIQFFMNEGCPGCEQLAVKYRKLGALVKGLFKIAVVDVQTQHGNDIAYQWGIDSLPTFIIVGDDKTKPMAKDPEMIFEELLLCASRTIENRAVTILGTSNEEEIHNEFRSSGGSRSKTKKRAPPKFSSVVRNVNTDTWAENVLHNENVVVAAFTRPEKLSRKLRREYEECASRLVGESATAVWINTEESKDLAEKYNIERTPTILIFPGGLENKTPEKAYKYKGDRFGNEIAGAVLREVDKTGRRKKVLQLTGMNVLEENCRGYNHVCVLAAMPPLVETGADGRRKYLAIIERMQTVFRGSTYSFLWFEGGTQPGLEEAMGLTFGFPAVATFTLDRTAYSVLRGSFSDKGISTYLHAIASGKNPVQMLPYMFPVETVAPWDGTDSPQIVYEEEIPLSEIMEDWHYTYDEDATDSSVDDEDLKAESDTGHGGEKETPEAEPVVPEEEEEDDDESFFRDEL